MGRDQQRYEHRSEAIGQGRYLSMSEEPDISPGMAQEDEVQPMQSLDWIGSSPSSTYTSKQPDKSNAEYKELYGKDFRASLLPAPLRISSKPLPQPPAKDETDQKVQLEDNSTTIPRARPYGGAASKVKEQLGVNDVAVDFRYLDPPQPAPQARPRPVLPTPPSRALWRSSLSRMSLTPSEMPYPMHMLRAAHNHEDGYDKVEETLGLRRMSVAPPVPPKSTSRNLPNSSDDILPSHSEPSDNDREDSLNGRIAWMHSLTGMLVVFNCWGIGNAFGLFQAYFSEIYLPRSSPSAIAWIGSTQLALVFGLGVPVGRMVDKGYFRVMFHGGTLLMLFGLFLSSVCKSLWSLWLVNGLITGLGMGMVFCSGMVALMTWFDERKVGAAMALGAAGSCLGGIVYILLARHFLKTDGYKTTMLALGGVAAVTMIPANIVFRVRGQKHRFRSRKQIAERTTRLNWRAFASTSYILAAAGMFFSFLGVYFGFVYIVSFASTILHLSNTASTNLLIYMLAANLPGRFLPALISDRCIGPLNTIIPSVFLSSAIVWLWAASGEHRGSLTVIACFYGFVSAGIQVLYAPTVYSFCLEPATRPADKVTDTESLDGESTQLAMDRIGIKAGGIFTCVGLACLIGLPIGGALIAYRTERGLSQPYLGAQVFAGVSLLIGGCCLLASRVAKSGWAAKRA